MKVLGCLGLLIFLLAVQEARGGTAGSSSPEGAEVESTVEQTTCGEGICLEKSDCRRCRNSFQIDFIMGKSSGDCGEGGWFEGDVGYLWNLKKGKALGGKMYVGGDDCGERFGFRFVARRWISPEVSFEFAPGIALGGSSNQSFPAASIQLAMDIGGYVGVVGSLEQVRTAAASGGYYSSGSESETRWEGIIGVRVSSFAVPLALGALILAAAASGGVMGGG